VQVGCGAQPARAHRRELETERTDASGETFGRGLHDAAQRRRGVEELRVRLQRPPAVGSAQFASAIDAGALTTKRNASGTCAAIAANCVESSGR
jgi:hypothetical protein